MIIKKCPHCGGTARLKSNFSVVQSKYFIWVSCDVCGARSRAYKEREDPATNDWETESCKNAVDAWNLRNGDLNEDEMRQE